MSDEYCQVCGQHCDGIYITSHRNTPFIDGKTYKKMCFGCFWTPVEYIQHYDRDGKIESEEGPFYDHEHLATPEELANNSTTSSLEEAQICVRAVKKAIAAVGLRALKKLKLHRPKQETELCDEKPSGKRGKRVKPKPRPAPKPETREEELDSPLDLS